MKIGDTVVRAYAHYALIPGIIVDTELKVLIQEEDDEPYELVNYIVYWSDGSQSTEMYEELDYLKDVSEYLKATYE